MALVTSRYCDICQCRTPTVIAVRLSLPGSLMSIGVVKDQETVNIDLCLDCLESIKEHLTIRPGAP